MEIPTVIVEFKSLPDFICSKEEYKRLFGNKFFKLCADLGVKPQEVLRVRRVLLDENDYPSTVWEG